MTKQTLIAFFNREPGSKEVFEQGKDLGRVSLRRTQFKLAGKSAAMAIFLGKNLLGQSDRHEHALASRAEDAPETSSARERVMRRIALLSARAKEEAQCRDGSG